MQELLISFHLNLQALLLNSNLIQVTSLLIVLMRTPLKPTSSSLPPNNSIPHPIPTQTKDKHITSTHNNVNTLTQIINKINTNNLTKTTTSSSLVNKDLSNTKIRLMQISGRSLSPHSRLKLKSSNLIQMSFHLYHLLKLPLLPRLSLPSNGTSSPKRLLDSQWLTLWLKPTISTFNLSSKLTPKSLSQFRKSLLKKLKLRRY